ncbi:MAG: RluA family pseudouridine synthase [Bacteroidetes bacterium]|nr:MAG: RluA family pseudouridine synthase [Bacteroidota bacterium]
MPLKNQAILLESIQVPKLEKAVRLSDLSSEYFRTINSRKAFKNTIKKGLVHINGSIGFTADFIYGGEEITVYESEIQPIKPSIELKIEVLYEDDYLAIVNKPAGIVVSGNKKWTLENALPGNLTLSSQSDAIAPEPIHRLDYPTSGVLLIGKTRSIIISLNKLFEERSIQKIYYAICIGEMKDQGLIEIDVDEKVSKTEFEVLERVNSPKYNFLNLVELKPHSGRRHQLRKHLSAIGNPILGDLLYGKEGLILKGKGLYLHALSLEFEHPITNDNIRVEAPLPKKYKKIFS